MTPQVTLLFAFSLAKSIPLFCKIKPLSLIVPNVWNYHKTGPNLAMNSGDEKDSSLDNIDSFLKYLSS